MKNHNDIAEYHQRFELQPIWETEVMKEEVDDGQLYFNTYCDGDMDSDDHTDPITFDLNRFPAGSKIIVQVPICNDCGLDPTECDCDENAEDAIY